MFASDLKIVPLAANDVVHSSKGDNINNNNSPMIRYQKQQHHYSQKYQNNHHNNNNNNNGNNNRKKFQKVPTVNNNNINANVNTNKNHHNNNNNNNGQSYSTNNRKKQYNSTSSSNTKSNNNNSNNNNITNNNNSNLNKNSNNTYNNTPTRGVTSSSSTTTNNNTVVIKNNNTNNNICSDQNLVPKNRCDTLVSKNNTIASDLTSPTSNKFQKPAASSNSNSLVSSSSSLSSSLSSSSSSSSSSSNSTSSSTAAVVGTNNSSTNNNNKNRLTNRFNTASNHHRKKVQQQQQQQPQPAAEIEINNKQKSPIPIMVIHNNNNGLSNHHLPTNQQLPAVFTAPICTTSSAPSSAPVSPSSYSLNFLHSVGVQMAHNGDSRHMGNNHHQHQHHHVYSNSATVSPAGSTHNMIMQGQRIIYQDVQQAPPSEKQRHYPNQNNGQRKFSPKAHSPPYNHRSYDIPILINNNHHSAGGDHFSSPYNYPPLNNNNHNNYKRNSYIPVSHHQYQKQQNDCYSNGNNAHTPTYNRNRNQNQQKAWNNNGGVNAHKNASNGGNGMLKHHNSDYNNQSNQMISRVKNHQNLNNLTYVTTDAPPETNNNKNVYGNSRSQSSSPKMDYPQMVNKATNTTAEHRGPLNMMTPIPVIGKGDSFSPGGSDDTHQRVASEGYESDSSNSSSCDKRASTGHSNFLSSSSSSLSSTEIPYHPPPSIVHALNYPTSFAEDDLPIQHYYGSEQNLSQWIPALHAQFMFSAHGIYPPNGSITEFQQQQFKKSQSNRSSYRGGRGRNKIHNNDRSTDNTNNDISFFNPADRFLGRSHIAELREAPRTLLTCSKWDNLSQGIWNKFVNAQQTDDTFKRKMKLWRYLYIIVKNAYPRLGLYLVGSTMSGFGADTSDIDMCLVSKAFSAIDPRMEALFNLTLLKECLMKTGEFEKFNLIEAKVPILRFKDKDHNLEVDLNFNNCVGIKNTHLLFCYSQLDWRLRPLVLVTKLWAQYHNINNAKTMTISSYSLVLMVIHFLQCAVSPPVLPCLHEMYPDKFHFLHRTNDFGCVDMNETLDPYNSQNNQSLGQLFLEFLHYYSNFNYSQYAISIRTGALIPIEYCRQAKSLKNDIHQWKELCIEEPFDLTNTARSVYDSDTFERVKLVFVSSFRVLQETLDINSIFSPLVPAGLVQEK